MRFLARLFMSPAQRALTDASAYDRAQPRDALQKEIEVADGYCHERRGWMLRAVEDLGDGPSLTIRDVERAAERSARKRDENREPAFHNFAIASALGDHGLLWFMVERANQIADGIQPGAKDMLADAF